MVVETASRTKLPADLPISAAMASVARPITVKKLPSLLPSGSHVPHAHDAQRPLCGLPPLCTGEVGQYGTRPLQYAAGVAACCRGDPYAVRRAPRCVDVVEPDGGRGDQTDARTCEQAFVAAGAGADDQGVGVAHVLRGDPAAGQVAYLGPRLKDSLKKGDGTVGDDFHGWLLFPDFFSFREANIGKK